MTHFTRTLSLISSLAFVSLSPAQIELQRNMNPGPGLRYTSRGTVAGPSAGWVCERYPALGVTTIMGMRAVIQDQDCVTRSMTRMAIMAESSVAGTPDENLLLFDSGSFLLPAGVGTCAWSYSLWIPAGIHPPTAPTGNALFTAVFVDPAPLWVADGTSSWMMADNTPSWGEFPNGAVRNSFYPPTVPGEWPGAEFGASFDSGSGGGAATRYSGLWRIYSDNTLFMRGVQGGVEYDLRVGVSESPQSAGLYATVVTAGPDNFGMAGRFPDFTNQTNTAPVREDNLVFQTTSPSMIGTGIEPLFVDPFPLRRSGLPAVDLYGVGRLELSPATAQAFTPSQTVTARTTTHRVDLDALGLRAYFRSAHYPIHLTFQAVRVDLATGRVEVSRGGELSVLP